MKMEQSKNRWPNVVTQKSSINLLDAIIYYYFFLILVFDASGYI